VKEMETRLKISEKNLHEARRLNEKLGQEAAKKEIQLKKLQLNMHSLPQVTNVSRFFKNTVAIFERDKSQDTESGTEI
jgi:hypothetical protein